MVDVMPSYKYLLEVGEVTGSARTSHAKEDALIRALSETLDCNNLSIAACRRRWDSPGASLVFCMMKQ